MGRRRSHTGTSRIEKGHERGSGTEKDAFGSGEGNMAGIGRRRAGEDREAPDRYGAGNGAAGDKIERHWYCAMMRRGGGDCVVVRLKIEATSQS